MTTTDLSTQTPVEIDTALAEIYTRLYRVQDQIAQTLKHAKDYEQGLRRLAEGDARYTGWSHERLAEVEAKYEALQEQAIRIENETLPYESEFRARGGWTRFFHVTNSNGHIHSSMNCSTCFPTTRYAWLTEMSGQSEAEALETLGKQNHVLCSVCFPNAPVWMFSKRQDPSVCEGSGRIYDSSLPHRTGYYTGNWAECPVCHTNQTVTKAYKIRKHQAA